MVQVQLTRLASVKTAARRTPSTSETAASLVPRRSSFAAPQVRTMRHARADEQRRRRCGCSAGVFAHGALGKDAVLVASLSNSTLLIIRIGPDGIRSWLLDWPLAGKIRGLCVSPDLQCVLCVTEGLEGVYLLAVDNLGDQDEAQAHPPHAPRRTVAETAFPSLAHLASRGEQRKRATGAKAGHPSAEPVFIASLARQSQSDDDRGGRRHSTGSSARAPRRRSGARSAAAPFECLWWVTRDGSHFAVIGGPGGELHFLDLERLDAWVVTPPPPTMARGRVCALTVVTGLAGTAQQPRPRAAPVGSDSAPLPPDHANSKAAGSASGGGGGDIGAPGSEKDKPQTPPRHLVAVLETGAVFVVLLERENPDDEAGSGTRDKSGKSGKRSGGDRGTAEEDSVRLRADWKDQPGFAPLGTTPAAGGGDFPSDRLRMSIVSRAWGNKCAVKILRGTEKQHQQGWGLDWGTGSTGKQQALRTETVRQLTLPVDHHAPEQHALAVVDGSWAPASGSGADQGGASGTTKDVEASAPSAPGASWGLVWSESCVYRVDLGGDADRGVAPRRKESAPSTLRSQAPARRQKSVAGTAGSLALRRPSAASVRRARELHAAGRIAEATRVAMQALDGSEALSMPPPPGAGGGATTRMVREELANSLLEWLVRLHVQQTSAGHLSTAGDAQVVGRGVGKADGEARARGLSRGSREGLAQGRRPSKPTRSSARRGSKNRVVMPSTPSASLSELERYLLSSRDYDPVLAATLLHSHGEADLAVVAGTAREGGGRGGAAAALPRVLRVLAESAWVPRLGPRGVEALCGDDTGGATRAAILAGGGTLLAALEPRLRLRLLLSDRSIMFGGVEAADSGVGGEAQASEAAGGGTADRAVRGAIAGVRTHLSPIVSQLPVEDLDWLVSRLAQWCSEDTVPPAEAHRVEEADGTAVVAAAAAERVTGDCGGGGAEDCPSEATLEALEVLLQALCELSGRRPPAGEHHRSAWSHAGCIVDADAFESREGVGPTPSPLPHPRLEWGRVASLLRSLGADHGAAPADVGGVDDDACSQKGAGGIPTAARRRLLHVLPIARGWHDSVGGLVRAREAGCWAAVALQLELAGNGREAASATLHGVVSFLQEAEVGSPAESSARILSGKTNPSERTGSDDQDVPGAAGATVATAAERIRTASGAILRVIDKYAFPRRGGPVDVGDNDGGTERYLASAAAASVAPPALPTTSGAVLARACVLAEALCVWRHFGLPSEALETALQPRLEDRDSVRVFAAVFFPQLSADAAILEYGPPGRDRAAPQEDLSRRGGLGAAGAWGGQATASSNGSRRSVATTSASRPTPAQIEAASGLGLSPRFSLALMRTAASPSAAGSARSSRHGPRPPHLSGTGTAGDIKPFSADPYARAPSDRRRSGVDIVPRANTRAFVVSTRRKTGVCRRRRRLDTGPDSRGCCGHRCRGRRRLAFLVRAPVHERAPAEERRPGERLERQAGDGVPAAHPAGPGAGVRGAELGGSLPRVRREGAGAARGRGGCLHADEKPWPWSTATTAACNASTIADARIAEGPVAAENASVVADQRSETEKHWTGRGKACLFSPPGALGCVFVFWNLESYHL
ncbi:unnamed protein product [Scytosiphon promiscuus]